jgi:hypothetical protein
MEVPFRLVGIKTTEFAKFEQAYMPEAVYEVAVQLGFRIIDQENVIEVNTHFTFELKNKPVLLIAISCFFELQSLNEYINKDSNTIILPKNIAQHFAVLTIGTARGVLHAKTEGININALILPSINVADLVNKDIVITPSKS